MVLIIRNNRIQSRRSSKIKTLLSYVVRTDRHKDCAHSSKSDYDYKLDDPAMSLVSVLGVFFLYTMAMFTLPFAAFFGAQHVMKNEFHADQFTVTCVSVTAAVVVTNAIIMSYAYRALYEPDDTKESMEVTEPSTSRNDLNKKDD